MEHEDWLATRTALADAVQRYTELLTGVQDPDARAIGEWSVRDVAAHLIEVAVINTSLATSTPPPAEWDQVYAKALTASMDQVGDMNALAVAVVREREPSALAERFDAQVRQLLERTSTAEGSEQIEWLGGTKLPVQAVLGHMLSEVFVHGNDVGRTVRRSLPLEPPAAGLIFRVFLKGILSSPDVAAFAANRAGEIRPVSVELRLRGAPWMTLVSSDAGLHVHDHAASPDVRITADPAALWLVMTGRASRVRAAMNGSVVVWGRRPWRLGRLVEAIRMP